MVSVMSLRQLAQGAAGSSDAQLFTCDEVCNWEKHALHRANRSHQDDVFSAFIRRRSVRFRIRPQHASAAEEK